MAIEKTSWHEVTAANAVQDPAIAYELAVSRHRYELEQTISRNNFFMVFQGVIVGGSFSIGFGTLEQRALWLLVCILGVCMSIQQTRMALAGRYQIASTRRLAAQRELDLLNAVGTDRHTFFFFPPGTKGLSDGIRQGRLSDSIPNYSEAGVKTVRESFGLSGKPSCSEWIDYPVKKLMSRGGRSPAQIAVHVGFLMTCYWVAAFLFGLRILKGV